MIVAERAKVAINNRLKSSDRFIGESTSIPDGPNHNNNKDQILLSSPQHPFRKVRNDVIYKSIKKEKAIIEIQCLNSAARNRGHDKGHRGREGTCLSAMEGYLRG